MGNSRRHPAIIVTAVGGGVGQSILKSLYGGPNRIVACDAKPDAAGLFAAHRGYVVPYARDPGFIDRIIEVASLEGASLLFPGLDSELPVLARSVERLRDAGVVAIVSRPGVVDLADDKLATHDFLAGLGLPTPWTIPAESMLSDGISFPVVLKPRRGGSRSQGVYVVRDSSEMALRLGSLDVSNYVLQEYLDGPEFTCGTVNLDGACYGPIVMRRVLRAGDTHKAYVVREPSIDDVVRRAALALQPFGACNFQLRMVDEAPMIFEINARCSGTTAARSLAGFNEPRMVADALLSGAAPTYDIKEMAILRYWNELAVPYERIDAIRSDLAVDGDGSQLWSPGLTTITVPRSPEPPTTAQARPQLGMPVGAHRSL